MTHNTSLDMAILAKALRNEMGNFHCYLHALFSPKYILPLLYSGN